jgi:hypothetical protein
MCRRGNHHAADLKGRKPNLNFVWIVAVNSDG